MKSSRRSFVANVSHELKTPMTTIGGFIDGILDGTIEPEDEKKYLGIVSDEVKRLTRLVTGMLNMSKLEAGEMNINAREFDISESVFRTVLNFEKKIEDTKEYCERMRFHDVIARCSYEVAFIFAFVILIYGYLHVF